MKELSYEQLLEWDKYDLIDQILELQGKLQTKNED